MWACHAGAAVEGLCYTAGSRAVSGSVYEFYYNYTYDEGYTYPGSISYIFSYEGDDGGSVKVPSFMHLYPNFASNVSAVQAPLPSRFPSSRSESPVAAGYLLYHIWSACPYLPTYLHIWELARGGGRRKSLTVC